MRVLLVTPFSPDEQHDHAAADTLVKLVPRLAARHELHVYAPPSNHEANIDKSYELWESSYSPVSKVRAKFGLYPAWLRSVWSSQMSLEAISIASHLNVDLIHCEYLQTAEICGHTSVPTVLGLHDVTTDVMQRAMKNSSGAERAYRTLEYIRTSRFETRSVAKATGPFVLSEVDLRRFVEINSRTQYIRPALEPSNVTWHGRSVDGVPRVVFTGAMWRSANVAAALRLATKIMPLVWAEHSSAILRVVGSRPSREVLSLADNPMIEVVGYVDSLEAELAAAAVVACPTVFGGGILMKLLTALGVGCPVVADRASGESVGLPPTSQLADNDEDFAARLTNLLACHSLAREAGASGRAFISSNFSWTAFVDRLDALYQTVANVAPS